MCWHKWSKWEEIKRKECGVFIRGKLVGKQYVEGIHEQRRQCLKCDKVEIKTIYH